VIEEFQRLLTASPPTLQCWQPAAIWLQVLNAGGRHVQDLGRASGTAVGLDAGEGTRQALGGLVYVAFEIDPFLAGDCGLARITRRRTLCVCTRV
jgi:hypothetical protein